MGLEDLNSNLYSREKADDRETIENPYEPEIERNLAAPAVPPAASDSELWQPVVPKETLLEKLRVWFREHKKKVYRGAGILAVVLLVGGFSVYWYTQFFSERNTAISVSVEEQVKSGETVTPRVKIRNDNRTVLENVKIILELPEGFVASVPLDNWTLEGRRAEKTIGSLTKDQEVEVTLPGKLYGNKGAIVVFTGIAQYTPAKVSGVYEASAEGKTSLLSSPLFLQVSAPQQLVTGQDLDYEIIYRNEGNETLHNVRLKAFFPEGFQFRQATPGTTAFDTWSINTFQPGDSGKVVVSGSLEGVWNEEKPVRFALGYEAGDGEFIIFNDATASTKMIASPLSIRQVVNDGSTEAVTPSKILTYQIQYHNNSNQGYRDAIVAVTFENPEFLDWANLDLPRGAYNQSTQTISWQASEVSELRTVAPGASGMLTFSVPVISDFSQVGVVKNKAIVSKATIDSPDIQSTLSQNKLIGSSTANIPLGTLVGFQIYAYHEDSNLETDGPLPPEAGEKTEYVLRTRVTNPANEVTQGKVVIALPGYMRFTGKKSPEEASISYNDRTNEMTWNVGTLSPGAAAEVRVQTEFSPGADLIDKEFKMFEKALFTGMDSFTKQGVSLPLEPRNNMLSDDPSTLPTGYRKVKK